MVSNLERFSSFLVNIKKNSIFSLLVVGQTSLSARYFNQLHDSHRSGF